MSCKASPSSGTMKPIAGVRNGQVRDKWSTFYHNVSLQRREQKFIVLLLVLFSTYYYIVFACYIEQQRSIIPKCKTVETVEHNFTNNDSVLLPSISDSLSFKYSDDARFSTKNDNVSLLVVFPYSSKQNNISQNDKRSISKLSSFLGSMNEFHGATCLVEPLVHSAKSVSEGAAKPEEIKLVGNISLDSSWCRFITKNWSVQIRNTGLVGYVHLENSLPVESNGPKDSGLTSIQNCNIAQGPFMIRKDIFHKLGGLIDGFGRMTLLEFFLRSKGQLKMAKLANCVWTPEITRADRGTLEGSNIAPEYASFANKHKIVRIVMENRIEWTACAANWKLCSEKPYIRPRGLPSVAAPICCSAVLGKMLKDFTWALNALGVEYRVVYGTLLGAVRSQTIIPWTYDIDIALPVSEFAVNTSAFSGLQRLLGKDYYVGKSFGMRRAHLLLPPYIDVNTTAYFDGPDDVGGNALFSREVEEAVKGMLPVSRNWRERCYVDFYKAPAKWIEGSSLVTINNEQFLTVKEIDYELSNWYGKNYLQPVLKGRWSGLTDR